MAAANDQVPLGFGELDVEAVQRRLQKEFALRAKQEANKDDGNPFPTDEELQQDFDLLIEARALQLIEKSRSRSGSIAASAGSRSARGSFSNSALGSGSPFFKSNTLPDSKPTTPPFNTQPLPSQDALPPRAPLHHLPSGLSMTAAAPPPSSSQAGGQPVRPSPLQASVAAEGTQHEDPEHGESALSSGANTPSSMLSRQSSRRSSRGRLSRRPSMRTNENSYEVR